MSLRVLVIGGTGLIGSEVARRLVEAGRDVTVLTRGRSYRPIPAGCAHLVGDRSRADFPERLQEMGTFDCVIDMVCYRPQEADEAIRALAGRTNQYVLTSTVDVYRKPATRYPYREDEGYGGIGEYARNKVECERRVWAAHELGALQVTVIRPATTYGDLYPPVHSLGRSTTYLDRLRRGRPIVVHGDGSTLWSLCHAEDVATAFVGAAGNERALGKAYHAAGEEWVTINQLHEASARAIGAPRPELVHIPTDALLRLAPDRTALVAENLRYHSIFDNTAARTELGFRSSIALADGLRRWYRSLEEAGLIESSDDDPTDDRVIEAWRDLERFEEVATPIRL